LLVFEFFAFFRGHSTNPFRFKFHPHKSLPKIFEISPVSSRRSFAVSWGLVHQRTTIFGSKIFHLNMKIQNKDWLSPKPPYDL